MIEVAVLLIVLAICVVAVAHDRAARQQFWVDPDTQGRRMDADDVVPVRVVNYGDPQ